MIKHFNRLGQLDANLVQLKKELCVELANATKEVISDFKEKCDFDEEPFLKVISFNPKMFEHTIDAVDLIREQATSLLKSQLQEILAGCEDQNQS